MSGPEEGGNSATDTNALRLVSNMSVSYTLCSSCLSCFCSRILLYPVSCLAHLSGYSRVSRSGQVPTKIVVVLVYFSLCLSGTNFFCLRLWIRLLVG